MKFTAGFRAGMQDAKWHLVLVALTLIAGVGLLIAMLHRGDFHAMERGAFMVAILAVYFTLNQLVLAVVQSRLVCDQIAQAEELGVRTSRQNEEILALLRSIARRPSPAPAQINWALFNLPKAD